MFLVGSLAVGACLVATVRWLIRRWPWLGRIVALGVLARAGLGVVLFWASYMQWPLMRSLQLGDGFWVLALDAQGYFGTAVDAAEHGLWRVPSAGASPNYVRALALWLNLVGYSPASALLLNLCCFLGTSVLLLRALRVRRGDDRHAGATLLLAAFAFQPTSIIHATQPLKDEFFTFFLVAAVVGGLVVFDALRGFLHSAREHLPRLGLGVAGLAASLVVMAGVRSYMPMMLVWCLGFGLLVGVTVSKGQRLRYALTAVAVLIVCWHAYAVGAGPYYSNPVGGYLFSRAELVLSRIPGLAPPVSEAAASRAPTPVQVIERSRDGFAAAGGDTNITAEGSSAPVKLATGLLAMWLPVSLLKTLGIAGGIEGRGLLLVTDLDTVFLLVCALGILLVCWRTRPGATDDLPFLAFLSTFAGVTMLAMAYVVTNYGTLFRLRMVPAALLYLLVVGFARAGSGAVGTVSHARRRGRDAEVRGARGTTQTAVPEDSAAPSRVSS